LGVRKKMQRQWLWGIVERMRIEGREGKDKIKWARGWR
jgi:hypothetical protein